MHAERGSMGSLSTALRAAGRARAFKRGERLVLEGGRGGAVMLIAAGVVKIVATTPDGDEVTLAIRRAGDVIGDHSALSGERQSANVLVVEPGEAIIVPTSTFLSILENDPEVAREQFARLLRLLREADERIVEVATMRAAERVVRCLRSLTAASGSSPVELSQEELAALATTSRGVVASVLGQLRDRGIVTTARRSLEVVDRAALDSLDPGSLTDA